MYDQKKIFILRDPLEYLMTMTSKLSFVSYIKTFIKVVIHGGYKDCNIDQKYLKTTLKGKFYFISLKIFKIIK